MPVLLCPPQTGVSPDLLDGWKPRLTSVRDVVAFSSGTVRDVGPFVVFGHGNGALRAHRLARELARMKRGPLLLIVSGRNGPAVPALMPGVRALGLVPWISSVASGDPGGCIARRTRESAAFWLATEDNAARRSAGRRAAGHGSTGHALSRIARVPLTGQQNGSSRQPLLRCPVVALYGADDPLTRREYVAAWANETTGSFRMTELPGSHNYVLAADFSARLEAVLGEEMSLV